MKVSRKLFWQLIGVGGLMGDTGCASFILLKYPMYQLHFPVWLQLHYLYLYWNLLFTEGKLDWVELLLGLIIVSCMLLIFNVEFEHKIGIIFGVICAFLGATFTVLNGKLFGKTSSENIIFMKSSEDGY